MNSGQQFIHTEYNLWSSFYISYGLTKIHGEREVMDIVICDNKR